MEKIELYKYPLRVSNYEVSGLPAMFKEIDFEPRRITVKTSKVKLLGGLFEFNSASVIFDR